MADMSLFPAYTPRQDEEERIQSMIERVQQDGTSRALLLYGEGGVGKSYLLRYLSDRLMLDNVIYVGPIDVDDAEYWSTTNLNHFVAEKLSQGQYFKNYKAFLVKMPEVEHEKMGHETVLAHMRKANRAFVIDYQNFIQHSRQTPVLIFDTVEAIRGTDTLTRLLLWVKKLPGTLFIIAGRPVDETVDPVVRELDEHPRLVYEEYVLREFSRTESMAYLKASSVMQKIEEDEQQRLALMSKGHPLWLALSIYYMGQYGIPEEVDKLKIDPGQTLWPYQNGALHDAYLRRLVIPYREGDFWHEAVFRLGIVRRRVSKELWQQMMQDCPLPTDAPTWDTAWEKLLDFPWVRPRANEKYVTLQDALAEELAKRIIPYRDFEKDQRVEMWQNAVADYDRQIDEQTANVARLEDPLDTTLAAMQSDEIQGELLEQILDLDTQKFEIFLLQTTRLYYQMLLDFETGTKEFLRLLDEANRQHQIRFVELLWAEMQRFLPGEYVFDPLEDVIKSEIERFKQWYLVHPEIQFEVITRISKYLYEIGQIEQSERLLNKLWEACEGNLTWEYHILLLRGNAKVRHPGHAKEAEADFEGALERTRNPQAPSELKRLEGKALSELGYYCRNMGDWQRAGYWYLEALRTTPLEALREKAAVQSQYAYLQALRGVYQDAYEMVDSALEIRQVLGEPRDIGMALSVKGEVFRYERKFNLAMQAYKKGETIFAELNSWGWLGLLRQQMAICLFQACRSGELLQNYADAPAMLNDAKEIALNALDFCREYSRRSYPSALNRAGRILGMGFGEYDLSLQYLQEGINEAKALADGWFWFANLIEYVELSYSAWKKTSDQSYMEKINTQFDGIEQVYQEYQFPDLRGRWQILQALIKAESAIGMDECDERMRLLDEAREHFATGYPLIAFGHVGSHGAIALQSEFQKLENVLINLDQQQRSTWFSYLNKAWGKRSTSEELKSRQESSLLASLSRLYVKLLPSQEKGGGA